MVDLAAGVVFVVVLGLVVRKATRSPKPQLSEPDQPLTTLLGVVPAPRREQVIDSYPADL